MDEIKLEFLFVADGAQAVNGKLYVLGGGWSHLWLPEFPGRPPIPFSIALGIKVPWSQTNRRFAWRVEVHDADGGKLTDEPVAWGEFEQGRPPGLTPGADQRVTVAIPVGTEFPSPGRYTFVVKVADVELGRVVIDVGRASPMPMSGPPES